MPITEEEHKFLDAQITEKLDAAIKPLLEKLDTLAKIKEKDNENEDEKDKDGESNEKTDSDKEIKLAADVLRTNLKGCLTKDKLDAMSLNDLHIANQLKSEMKIGKGNPIEQKNTKTDSKSDSEWGCEVET